jgi:hypothetical protein
MKHKLLKGLLGLLLTLPFQPSFAIPPEERAALTALYDKGGGANWSSQEGWMGAEGTECQWEGVYCSLHNAHVIKLDLLNKGVTSFPAELGKLSALTFLSLGMVIKEYDQEDIHRIPAELGLLSNLKVLHLGGID